MNRYLVSALTLVGVPAGLAITGGNTQTVMSMTLAFWLAVLALFLRAPRTVLIVSLLLVAGLRGAYLVGSGWVWPATAAFVAVVLAGHLRTAVAAGGVALAYGFAWDGFVVEEHGSTWTLAHVGGETLWLAAALAAATAYRSTVRWQAEVARRLAQDEHERELDARRRRAEERVGIARDLHDVVSHTLAVVGVHLNVALDAFDSDPEEARSSLRLAQDVRGRAMTDLKSLVDVLREGEAPAIAEPADGLDGLERLAEHVRAAGLAVSLNEFGDRTAVPAPVATAVYRVVQESLTNTVRHAGASRVAVTVRYAPTSVVVDVQDDGEPPEHIVDGNGIAGMRERVAALGGALTTGPGRSGFTVRATIPFAA
ncbi:two-component sensor histidine kinase [Paractinoplanes deccanensis]|uniref:histidine kinase n=1 Tax=Paractinoplanes deccanensis TaxID=113561 RepID=A0ABQ3XVA0_9ACTN|nr:histidine kinase [Actinoplanes deccanensis]GID71643.1 two-component sensor histidine kinase [Actinoplanes deccanensis]